MRCKNCGSQNEDGRYICQNCGSPLYDEDDEILEDGYYDDDEYEDDDKKSTRKSIIVIIVLSVVLVALIAGIVFAVSLLGGNDENDTSESVSTSDVTERNTYDITEKATEKTTESTTESTTEKTTEKTTETTTKKPTEAKFRVSVDTDGNGTVSGDGEYISGKRATLVATAEAGAQFIGWYDNGSLVASGTKYSFTVTSNRNLTAVFQKTTEEQTSGEDQQQQQP